MEKPNVWLDPDLCSGCGNCSRIASNIFKLTDFGFSVVHLNGHEVYDNMNFGRDLEPHEVELAIQAAKNCPGEIIHIQL